MSWMGSLDKVSSQGRITGRVHQRKTTVQLYLLSASAMGFYFPQLEREPPVSTADVRELPRDTGLLESTWYCIYLLLRPYLAQIGFQICALLWSSLSSDSEVPSHVTMSLWIKKSLVQAPVGSVPSACDASIYTAVKWMTCVSGLSTMDSDLKVSIKWVPSERYLCTLKSICCCVWAFVLFLMIRKKCVYQV